MGRACCFVVVGLVAIGLVASAQNSGERPPDGGSREVLVSILIPSLPNAPFSAVVNTESIRQLASMFHHTKKSSGDCARSGGADFSGKTTARKS